MINSTLNFVIKITTNCPANCQCCINRKKEIKLKDETNTIFDKSIFEKICIKIKDFGGRYVCLSGGEPTIVTNIDEYFKIAHANDLAVRINTNGWGITKKNLANWLDLGLEQIVLSIYSLDRAMSEQIRGNGLLLERSLEAIKIIKESKSKNNFSFILQTVIMRSNYAEMPALLALAIDNHADFFWPSYLEDAVNLPTIRMEKDDIWLFKNEVIPQMINKIEQYSLEINHKENLINNLNEYYANEFNDYIYHNENYRCHWLGRHYTFYPNGTIYPCPGHEYFSSKFEYKIDYRSIDSFLSLENLMQNINNNNTHCKYCPQGVFLDIRLSNNDIKE